MSFRYDDLLGLTYAHGARVSDGQRSTDCYGLVLEVYRRMGIALPDPFAVVQKEWGRCEASENPVEWLRAQLGKWAKREESARTGCAVVFSRFGHVPDHIGVMVNDRQFLHAIEKAGVVLSHLDRRPWSECLVGFYDYCGA